MQTLSQHKSPSPSLISLILTFQHKNNNPTAAQALSSSATLPNAFFKTRSNPTNMLSNILTLLTAASTLHLTTTTAMPTPSAGKVGLSRRVGAASSLGYRYSPGQLDCAGKLNTTVYAHKNACQFIEFSDYTGSISCMFLPSSLIPSK